jgi:hypothetical protein
LKKSLNSVADRNKIFNCILNKVSGRVWNELLITVYGSKELSDKVMKFWVA